MEKNKVTERAFDGDLVTPLDKGMYSNERMHAQSHKLQLPSAIDREAERQNVLGFVSPISDNDKYSIKLSLESNDENAVLFYD